MSSYYFMQLCLINKEVFNINYQLNTIYNHNDYWDFIVKNPNNLNPETYPIEFHLNEFKFKTINDLFKSTFNQILSKSKNIFNHYEILFIEGLEENPKPIILYKTILSYKPEKFKVIRNLSHDDILKFDNIDEYLKYIK